MELGTFGAVMKFAMDLESSVFAFYHSVIEIELDDTIRPIIGKLHERSSKRIKLLERIRRENITEMILEPIDDFESDPFVITESIADGADSTKICMISSSIEKKRHAFYEKASQKIEFLIEAGESFERFAEENKNNLDEISKISL